MITKKKEIEWQNLAYYIAKKKEKKFRLEMGIKNFGRHGERSIIKAAETSEYMFFV